jgi:hypothetical protein
VPGLGVWGDEFLDEMDSFRDGNAANRMGTYLKWLIYGFDRDEDHESILTEAADRYCEIWGEDKIVTIDPTLSSTKFDEKLGFCVLTVVFGH